MNFLIAPQSFRTKFQIAKSNTASLAGSTTTATYSRGSTIGFGSSITITSNNHGLLVGDHINFTATSQLINGNPVNYNALDNSDLGRPNDDNITGALIYQTPDVNTFVIAANRGAPTVTGNCTYSRNDIYETFTSSDEFALWPPFSIKQWYDGVAS